MAGKVDAPGSSPGAREGVQVRVLPAATDAGYVCPVCYKGICDAPVYPQKNKHLVAVAVGENIVVCCAGCEDALVTWRALSPHTYRVFISNNLTHFLWTRWA